MKIHSFQDYYQNQVKLSFEKMPFSENAGHVWVISSFGMKWLLTHHSRRGLEFPGGKVEEGEQPEDAAIREVWEETGGKVEKITYIGQYEVKGKADTVVKNIYYCTVSTLIGKWDYMETKGPVLLDEIPRDCKELPHYSFIMKDDVLPLSLNYLFEYRLVQNMLS